MNERFIILLEKNLNNESTPEEEVELNRLFEENPELKAEFDEQKHIKGIITKMSLKNPSNEFWDFYWEKFSNKIERAFAWIAILIGALIVSGFAIYHAVSEFLADTSTPFFLKIGIALLTLGIIVLLLSVLREKLTIKKRDKYREIQR